MVCYSYEGLKESGLNYLVRWHNKEKFKRGIRVCVHVLSVLLHCTEWWISSRRGSCRRFHAYLLYDLFSCHPYSSPTIVPLSLFPSTILYYPIDSRTSLLNLTRSALHPHCPGTPKAVGEGLDVGRWEARKKVWREYRTYLECRLLAVN